MGERETGMKIRARVESGEGRHAAQVQTNEQAQEVRIAPKVNGLGSSVSGGELLFLALATRYCNDIFREASRLGTRVVQVEVEVQGEFGGVGEPGRNIHYGARVAAYAPEAEILELMRHTDRVAEIQTTRRAGMPVSLTRLEAVTLPQSSGAA